MTIEIKEKTLADVHEIEEFLVRGAYSLPYHHIYWLEAIKRTYGHDYRFFIALQDGRVTGAFPVCLFRGLSGGCSPCSIPYCDVGGVVCSDAGVRNALLEHGLATLDGLTDAPLELRQRKVSVPKLENLANRKVSMLLELPEDPEGLMRSFKSKLRSQIRKAEKNKLVFQYANDAESVNDFYNVFCHNMHCLGSPVHSLQWFQSLRELFGNAFLVGKVSFEDRVIGAGILMFAGETAVVPWASTLRQYNRLAPNMLLYWNLLRISCERGCRVFDFGRSTYEEGTYRFKQQWGAAPEPLYWCLLDRDGRETACNAGSGSKVRRIVESIWRHSPLAVANRLGPLLRGRISL